MKASALSRPALISYGLIAVMLLLVGWQHLGTPLLAVLFSYFVLSKLHAGRSKWLAVGLFVLVLLAAGYGLVHFINRSLVALPKVASTAIPSIIAYAEEHGVELPFTDYQSLKTLALESVKEQSHYVRNFANFARTATREFVFLIIGCVVAVSLFLNAQLEIDRGAQRIRNNLYSLCCDEIAARFGSFYESFATVMGAQIIISSINTALTSIFVLVVSLPHAGVVIGVTFLCGLLPVLGNLISNTVIVGIGFTISPQMALAALVFLVVIHKLEYFLNSKIIGDRIKNPVWLTLLALILGERLMGIPGMILAPVILHYLKAEASKIEVPPKPPERRPEPEPLLEEVVKD
jgi:predicted PurR-regulated permease PerM